MIISFVASLKRHQSIFLVSLTFPEIYLGALSRIFARTIITWNENINLKISFSFIYNKLKKTADTCVLTYYKTWMIFALCHTCNNICYLMLLFQFKQSYYKLDTCTLELSRTYMNFTCWNPWQVDNKFKLIYKIDKNCKR